MKQIWLIWGVLAAFWLLEAAFLASAHRFRMAAVMVGMAVLFAVTGLIVRRRLSSR